MQALTSVQQPCSNPSKSPERLRNAPTQKCGDFQQFCKLWKPLENYLAALAWRRPGVRVPSGPLPFCGDLQVKTGEEAAEDGHCLWLCAATQPALRRERGSYTLHPHRPLSSRLPWARGSNVLGSTGRNLPINQRSAYPSTAATCSFIPRSAEALRSDLCTPEMAVYARSCKWTSENPPSETV